MVPVDNYENNEYGAITLFLYFHLVQEINQPNLLGFVQQSNFYIDWENLFLSEPVDILGLVL